MTVTPAPIGICSSAEDTAPYIENITVETVGDEVHATGIRGSQMEPWIGSIDGNELKFGGSKVDGVGITTATFTLIYDPVTEKLSGSESWDWVSGQGACIGGTSVMSAIR